MAFTSICSAACIAFLFFCGPALGQDPASGASSGEQGAGPAASIETIPSDTAKAKDLSIEVLRAELRPLTKDQVKAQLAGWLSLLQKKCLEVRQVEVAALQSATEAEVSQLNARAVALRGERGRLSERVSVVADALERKNGDATDVRAYLKSIVVAPPITGIRAAWTTLRTWLVSADGGISLGLRILKALGVLVLFWFLARVAARVARRALRSARSASQLLRDFVVNSVRKCVFIAGILIAVSQLGVNMAPLLAIIGAAGLVVGFALQGTLSNFASGLLIMVYRPFDVGDFIEAGGASGSVESMTLMTTLVKTPDNKSVHVPNNKVWGDVITNVTANATRRVDLSVGVCYTAKLEETRALLLELAEAHPLVLKDPAPNIQVHELGDSAVVFIVRPWSKTEDYWTVYWELTQAMKERLDSAGIGIPFPQRDVHVHLADGENAEGLRGALS